MLVMTVHASKGGLEFPVVALPFTNADSGGRRNGSVFEEDLGLAVKIPGPDGPVDAPISLLIQHRRKQKEAAEARRLFYVAVTRARDHILFTGTLPKWSWSPSARTREDPDAPDVCRPRCHPGGR